MAVSGGSASSPVLRPADSGPAVWRAEQKEAVAVASGKRVFLVAESGAFPARAVYPELVRGLAPVAGRASRGSVEPGLDAAYGSRPGTDRAGLSGLATPVPCGGVVLTGEKCCSRRWAGGGTCAAAG